MVEIVVALDNAGLLRGIRLTGHAGSALTGANPACAAVSLMARTVARMLATRTGWTVDGEAPEPGNLSLDIIGRPGDTDEWLSGVTDTLMQALADIDEEYPDSVSVRIEENDNGS